MRSAAAITAPQAIASTIVEIRFTAGSPSESEIIPARVERDGWRPSAPPPGCRPGPLFRQEPSDALEQRLRRLRLGVRRGARLAMALELGAAAAHRLGDALDARGIGEHHAPEGVVADLEQLAVGHGSDRRAPPIAGEQRHLAEERAVVPPRDFALGPGDG